MQYSGFTHEDLAVSCWRPWKNGEHLKTAASQCTLLISMGTNAMHEPTATFHSWYIDETKLVQLFSLDFFDEIVRILPKNYRKISKSLEPNIQARWFSLMKSCISRKVSTLGLLKLYNIGTQWRDCFECSQNIRWQFKPNTLYCYCDLFV